MKRKIQTALLILTLTVIWGHSLVPADTSSLESGRVLELLRPVLETLLGAGNVSEYLVRKMAHFTEFAALGFQLALFLPPLRGPRRVLRAVEMGFFAAFLDESIQLLTEDRSGRLQDVWIDTAGVLFGALVALAVWHASRRTPDR